MRSRSQWKKNHWSVALTEVALSSDDELVFVSLLTGDEYGSSDFTQARVTERRIRGWLEWGVVFSVAEDITIGQNILLKAYIARLDESAVDAAIAAGAAALAQYDPVLDSTYTGNDIMWTYGGTVYQTVSNTGNGSFIQDSKFLHVPELDVPVSRKLEGDEGIFLVYKGSGSNIENAVLFQGCTRILFQE